MVDPARHVETRVRSAGFLPLGWFEAEPRDGLDDMGEGRPVRSVLLVGNAGPMMWKRFVRERTSSRTTLDGWSADTLGDLARELGGRAYFPFDKPPFPFQSWALRAGHVFASPLGITIHPEFGLWHAYRAAFAFTEPVEHTPVPDEQHPCELCPARPCLTTCPVEAFAPGRYDVPRCAAHVLSQAGADCLDKGCRARRACPVGREHVYAPDQALFHMTSFVRPFREVQQGSQQQ
jgi:hypothetical protein